MKGLGNLSFRYVNGRYTKVVSFLPKFILVSSYPPTPPPPGYLRDLKIREGVDELVLKQALVFALKSVNFHYCAQ